MTNTIPTGTKSQLNAGQIIRRAYRILGVLPSGGSPTADQTEQGLIALNFMLKGWQADGINLYRQEQLTIPVLAGMGIPGMPVTLVDLALGLEEARWVVQSGGPDQFERPLGVFSYIDYQTLPNKLAATTSGPSVIMFDKQAYSSDFYLWPPPSDGGILKMTIGRSVYDVTQSSDILDVPIEWTEGVIYNLADRLMDDEGVAAADPATAQRIVEHATVFYQKLLNFDRPNSIFIRPYGKKGQGKIWH